MGEISSKEKKPDYLQPVECTGVFDLLLLQKWYTTNRDAGDGIFLVARDTLVYKFKSEDSVKYVYGMISGTMKELDKTRDFVPELWALKKHHATKSKDPVHQNNNRPLHALVLTTTVERSPWLEWFVHCSVKMDKDESTTGLKWYTATFTYVHPRQRVHSPTIDLPELPEDEEYLRRVYIDCIAVHAKQYEINEKRKIEESNKEANKTRHAHVENQGAGKCKKISLWDATFKPVEEKKKQAEEINAKRFNESKTIDAAPIRSRR